MFTSSQPTHDGLNSFECVLSFVKLWCLLFVFSFGAWFYCFLVLGDVVLLFDKEINLGG